MIYCNFIVLKWVMLDDKEKGNINVDLLSPAQTPKGHNECQHPFAQWHGAELVSSFLIQIVGPPKSEDPARQERKHNDIL